MKQQILEKYTGLGDKSHLHMSPQIKEYLSTPEEYDENTKKEIINLPFPGNSTKNFEFRLKDEDMQPLSISYMSFVKNLHTVDLSFNRITDKGFTILSKLLAYAENIHSVNLKGNQIGDNGCESLSKALLEKKELTYLNLNTNKFGNLGLMAINELIFKNEKLAYLDVGCNRYDWDGIISITSAIKTSNESLRVLIMDDPEYKIQDQHFFSHFAEMLADNPAKKAGIEKLSLRLNKIRWEATKIIFDRLKGNMTTTVNRFLRVLDLSGNQIDFQGAMIIKSCLANDIVKLQSLNLSHNKLYDSGAKILAEGLASNTCLIHLDITSNEIKDEGFDYFGQKIKENKGLKSLKLFWENEFGEKSIETFKKFLESREGDFYPDFVIEPDYDPEPKNITLRIAYFESHIPDEEKYLIPK